jgi:hypothetical protein
MGALEGTGNLLEGGREATIGGISVMHSSEPSHYYYQRGVLMIPNEALDELLQALGRLGLTEKQARVEPISDTGITQVRLTTRRPTERLIEDLGGTIPVEPSYVLFSAPHVKGFAARRPIPAQKSQVPRGPRRGRGANVNVGVVDLGFFDPDKAGHPPWAGKGVILDKTIAVPDPRKIHPPYVGHGNAIVGIVKQLAPSATVYTSTIDSQASDAPGGTTDRRLAEAIERLLGRHRIHILVVPFGGSTRHGSMPVTNAVIEPHLGSTLVVASAGNDGLDPTMYPAADPDVVGAGSWKRKAADLGWLTKTCDNLASPLRALGTLSLADWSNKGISVQLGAAGVAVPAPFVEGVYKIGSGSQDKPPGVKAARFSGWGLFTGTSFSAAVVAGCVAAEVGGASPPTPEMLEAATAK